MNRKLIWEAYHKSDQKRIWGSDRTGSGFRSPEEKRGYMGYDTRSSNEVMDKVCFCSLVASSTVSIIRMTPCIDFSIPHSQSWSHSPDYPDSQLNSHHDLQVGFRLRICLHPCLQSLKTVSNVCRHETEPTTGMCTWWRRWLLLGLWCHAFSPLPHFHLLCWYGMFRSPTLQWVKYVKVIKSQLW
jgi:hypothetical protein